jgi:hypothetical protein
MISPIHMGYDEQTCLQRYATNVALARSVLIVGRSLQLRGHTIKRVCFNRVDFFDVGVFATFLDLMPNLERAEITSCDLIRYHNVPVLLDTVHAHNVRHGGKVVFDVSPRYNIGPLWENGKREVGSWDQLPVEERQGTYGLTFSNPGVRIPPAVVKLYIYDIAPRMRSKSPKPGRIFGHFISLTPFFFKFRVIEAGQMHMMDSNALFRRFLEKLPLHSKTVPRMEAIAEHKEYLERLFAKGKISEDQKARLQIRCAFAELVTMFGDPGYIQLYEDGLRSTTEKGTAARYGLWGDRAECTQCKTELALMYCTTGYVCDACQMVEAVKWDDYHYKKLKQDATRYLGCGYPKEARVPLDKTNMDFGVLNDEDGHSRIKKLNDFEKILFVEVPMLRKLVCHARKMDVREYTGLCIRDLVVQKRHQYDRGPLLTDTQMDLLRMVYYRKAVTLEDIQKQPDGRVDRKVGHF